MMQNSDAQAIINRIIQIEKNARKQVADAETERSAMPDEVKAELALRHEAAMAEIDTKLAQEAETAHRQNAHRMTATDQKYAACTEALEAAFRQNRTEWAETVFRSCIDFRA